MKILFISTLEAAPWGGSEELWHLLACQILDKGCRVTVDRIEWPEVPQKIGQLKDKGAIIDYRPNPHISRSKLDVGFRVRNKLFNQNLQKRFEAFAPDFIVISLSGTFDHYLLRLAPALLKTKVPFVIISQHTYEYTFIEEASRAAFKALFTKAQKIFFVSKRNKEVTERTLATLLPNAALIYNPIKIAQHISIPYPGGEQVKLACVARLETPYKGQDVLLHTLASPRWKGRNWQLSFFGKGPQEEYLKELIVFYQLSEKVFIKGHIENIAELWADHHLLVLPSHSEGTPLSLLEAAYCSRAAVVTDVGGNAEIVEDGFTGFVAETASVNALDKALEKAWHKREEWEMMGKESRAKVEKQVGYNNFSTIIDEVLSGKAC